MKLYHVSVISAVIIFATGCCGPNESTADSPPDASAPDVSEKCTLPADGYNASLTCATVYRGTNGSPSDLPVGSCDRDAWTKLMSCEVANCSWPAACGTSCQACIEWNCGAEITYCLSADGQL